MELGWGWGGGGGGRVDIPECVYRYIFLHMLACSISYEPLCRTSIQTKIEIIQSYYMLESRLL